MRPSRRTLLIAAAAGVAVVLIALVLVAAFAGGHARRPHLAVARSSPAATGSTSGVPGTALPIPVEDARAVVVRYLDDINTQNRSDATELICSGLVNDWKKKIDQPGGDFTVAVARAVFRGATAAHGGDTLSYELDVRPRTSDQVNTSTIAFTVTGSPGSYRLCGES